MVGDFRWLGSLMQVTDSGYPSGAFSHSFGLEGMVQEGWVTDAASLRTFLVTEMAINLIQFELPYFRLAYEAFSAGDDRRYLALMDEVKATLPTREIREAMGSLGRQRSRILREIQTTADSLKALEDPRGEQFVGVCAIQAVLMEVPLRAALSAHVYQALAHGCAVSLKLIRIGQVAAQSMLSGVLSEALPSWVYQSMLIDRERACSYLPVQDIASSRHETSFNRLFIS